MEIKGGKEEDLALCSIHLHVLWYYH